MTWRGMMSGDRDGVHFSGLLPLVARCIIVRMVAVALATFTTQARGIMFHHGIVGVGSEIRCQLEPDNAHDVNAIVVLAGASSAICGHLAREAASCLAPLLRGGFEATG